MAILAKGPVVVGSLPAHKKGGVQFTMLAPRVPHTLNPLLVEFGVLCFVECWNQDLAMQSYDFVGV